MDRLPEQPRAMPRSEKILERHLERLAVVYVRQSTVQQMMDHRESTNLQYGLANRAIALGWPEGRVLVIDEDLGKSASSAEGREGFARLVALRSASITWDSSWAWRCLVLRAPRKTGISFWRSAPFSVH